MQTTTKFNPVLVHIDHKNIESAKSNAKKLCDQWNKVLLEAEKLLNKKLTANERVEILKHQLEGVMYHLRANFAFPNADDDFNLKAKGIDLKPIKDALTTCRGVYSPDSFEIVNDKVQLSKKGIAGIERGASTFTSNARENEVLEFAHRLSDIINEGFEKKIFHSLDTGDIERAFDVSTKSVGTGKFAPNRHNIVGIRR